MQMLHVVPCLQALFGEDLRSLLSPEWPEVERFIPNQHGVTITDKNYKHAGISDSIQS